MAQHENPGRVDLRKAESCVQDATYYTTAALAAGVAVGVSAVRGILKGILPGVKDGVKVGSGKAAWVFPQSAEQKALPGRTYEPKAMKGCRIVEMDENGDPIL